MAAQPAGSVGDVYDRTSLAVGYSGRRRPDPRIAARLTGHARPDTVLVDREVAEGLAVDPRCALRPLRPLAVPGYRHLHPWVLERAD